MDEWMDRWMACDFTSFSTVFQSYNERLCAMEEWVEKLSETDSIKFKISSKTPRGKKDITKRHNHRHHKQQPGEWNHKQN